MDKNEAGKEDRRHRGMRSQFQAFRGLAEKLTFQLRSAGNKGLNQVTIGGRSASGGEIITNAKSLWQKQGVRRKPVGWSPGSK